MSAATSKDTTFRDYSSEQGKAYAQNRLGYHDSVYRAIFNHHDAHGGAYGLVVDVGCGPGLATSDLAPHFARAIGLDPSEGMIATARTRGGTTGSGAPVRFEVGSAEDLGASLTTDPVVPGSVDLLVAATAAHWFDLPAFWRAAARALRPGGTVALWAGGSICVDPSTPAAAKVQATLDLLETERVAEFMLPANWMVRGLYADLPLPWTLDGEGGGPVDDFDRGSFVRREWGTDAPGAGAADEFYAMKQELATLGMLEKVLGTASPVTRWRAANPDKVDTEKDVLRIVMREIEHAVEEAGVDKDKVLLKGGVKGVLLLVSKKP